MAQAFIVRQNCEGGPLCRGESWVSAWVRRRVRSAPYYSSRTRSS